MSTRLEPAIVRIQNKNSIVVGAGFLVTENLVLTCAHVVTQVLDISQDTSDIPTGEISLDFPLVATGKILTAKVIKWLPVQADGSGDDIACLELLSKPPKEVHPALLIAEEDLWGHSFRAFGFPAGYENGVWASGVLRAKQADGWIQIEDVKDTGYFIVPGFSGTAIWDEKVNGVVGMTVAAERRHEVRAAFVIPTTRVLELFPELESTSNSLSLPRDSFTFREQAATIKENIWDIFISHASEDKEEIARPLAEALQQTGLKVWYDEFTLKIGDSLRRSVERGISNSKYGVVILSPNFFAKEWTKRELDSLTAREITGGKVILPIWHNVTHQDVLRFSPNLADKLAVLTDKGLKYVVSQIIDVCGEQRESNPPLKSPVIHLRSEPLIVSKSMAQKAFKLSENWQPLMHIQNTYEDQGKIVVDHTTRLTWQKSGSDGPLTYKEAQTYINKLNREQFAGYTDWRFPTITELLSLLELEKQPNDLYINPIFDKKQQYCWSADTRSSGLTWGVYFLNGKVNWLNVHYDYHVRAVRSWGKTDIKKKSQGQEFEFETVTVNARGEIVRREQHTGRQYIENLGNGMILEMVYIPGGTFLMGSPETEKGSQDNERPQHKVVITPFYMGKYPVTQEQWEAVMRDNLSRFKGAKRPVENISWYNAIWFCEQLSEKTGYSYRLPSEAEWEYACRAGTTTPFHFGETITRELVNYSLRYGDTTEVGKFPPNAFGLYDMHGNVWEWCADSWHENYQGTPTDGSIWEEGGQAGIRVLRGGSWGGILMSVRCAYRVGYSQVNWFNDVGFRLLREVGG
jgi:formylglycine-generating enzyme required for sulfatase activity